MLGGFGAKKDVISSRRVCGWVREFVDESRHPGLNIMASEIQCSDPDCVPIETLLVIVSTTSRWTDKVLKPIKEVTRVDIESLSFGEFAKQDSAVPQQEHWLNEMIVTLKTRIKDRSRDEIGDIEAAFSAVFKEHLSRSVAQYDDSSAQLQVDAHDDVPSSRSGKRSSNGGSAPAVTMVPMAPTTPAQSQVTVVPMAPSGTSQSLAPTVVFGTSVASSVPPLPPPPSSSASSSASTRSSLPPPSFRSASMSTSSISRRMMQRPPGRRGDGITAPTHRGGVRARGCPCCDPDAMDNIIDNMLMENL